MARGLGNGMPRGRTGLNGNGGLTAPAAPRRGRGRGRKAVAGAGGQIGVASAALPGPGGRQLESRVQAGKITQAQAQRTLQQRQTLAKAFGPNWRDKLQVGGKSFSQVRQGLAKNPQSTTLAALNKKLLASRKSALEAARKKIDGEGSTTEAGA